MKKLLHILVFNKHTMLFLVAFFLLIVSSAFFVVQYQSYRQYTTEKAVLSAQNHIARTYFKKPTVTPTFTPTPTASPTATPTPTIKLALPTIKVASPSPTSTTAILTPIPNNAGSKMFGVNMSGAEFGDSNLPGTENKDFVYDTNSGDYGYFKNHNQTLIRIPFKWERIQNQANGPLSSEDLNQLKNMVNAAGSNGQKVILDLHNYGRYYNNPLSQGDAGKLADVWHKIATEFSGNGNIYGYELMNEPHDMPDGASGWATIAQTATDSIRQVDTSHYVIVPGYDWQSANRWPSSNPNLNINDSTGKLLYSAHEYFDHDQSGTYKNSYDGEGANPNTGVDLIQPFLKWLNDNHHQGIFTEYGVPNNDPRWLTVLDNFLSAINGNGAVAGGTYWAGGPWWGSYPLSVQPNNGSDQPQMQILQKY